MSSKRRDKDPSGESWGEEITVARELAEQDDRMTTAEVEARAKAAEEDEE